ncbi:MAG: HupE/UreJ family protein, partial [Myxococcales bacterium]|nr:HupE/UreJ family protein [Myxococcales bacterium]
LLDLGARAVEGELQIPVDQLSMALGSEVAADADDVARHRSDYASYVHEHLGLRTVDGAPWSVEVTALEPRAIDGAGHLVARFVAVPPPGAGTERFELRDDVVLHRVVSHRIHVFVRHDFRSARFDQPELVGVLRYQRTAIAVDRSQGSWWRGFVAVVALGVEHIEGGTDHLLFLLVLLLPVVLRPTAGRHDEPAGARASALAILKVVTAFTLGHSLTLALAATGVVTVASRPVEVLIAVSILVSAVHAVRPLFPRREAWIAAGFGLVHGLAFADRLAGVGYDGASLVLGILGFNLGIEAMQLLIVVVVAPSLVVLSTTRIYPVVRWGGALVAGLGAVGWGLERALGLPNPIGEWLDRAMDHGGWIAAALGGLALGRLAAGWRLCRAILRASPSWARSSCPPL